MTQNAFLLPCQLVSTSEKRKRIEPEVPHAIHENEETGSQVQSIKSSFGEMISFERMSVRLLMNFLFGKKIKEIGTGSL